MHLRFEELKFDQVKVIYLREKVSNMDSTFIPELHSAVQLQDTLSSHCFLSDKDLQADENLLSYDRMNIQLL